MINSCAMSNYVGFNLAKQATAWRYKCWKAGLIARLPPGDGCRGRFLSGVTDENKCVGLSTTEFQWCLVKMNASCLTRLLW